MLAVQCTNQCHIIPNTNLNLYFLHHSKTVSKKIVFSSENNLNTSKFYMTSQWHYPPLSTCTPNAFKNWIPSSSLNIQSHFIWFTRYLITTRFTLNDGYMFFSSLTDNWIHVMSSLKNSHWLYTQLLLIHDSTEEKNWLELMRMEINVDFINKIYFFSIVFL